MMLRSDGASKGHARLPGITSVIEPEREEYSKEGITGTSERSQH